jgi:aspartate ammonia-lyase
VLGYDRVAALVKRAVVEHRALIDVVIEDGALDAEQAAELLDAKEVAKGNRPSK